MHILVLPGDGIGPEITAATVKILNAASHRFNLGLVLVEDVVGHESLRRYGTTVRPDLLDQARGMQGIVLGPTATYDFKDETCRSKFGRLPAGSLSSCRPVPERRAKTRSRPRSANSVKSAA